MNVGYVYRNPFVNVCPDNSHALGSTVSPTFQPHVAPLEVSSGRYIRQLEKEVEETTRQYEAACQLLYRVALIQDISRVTLAESAARSRIVENESAAHCDALRAQFRSMTTLLRKMPGSPMQPAASVVQRANPLESMDWEIVSERIVEAVHLPLRQASEQMVRLVGTVPEKVYVALGAAARSGAGIMQPPYSNAIQGDADATGLPLVLQQQLEHMMARINEVAERLSHAQADGMTGTPADDCPSDGGGAISLQLAVKTFEESSRRIAEAMCHIHQQQVVHECSSSSPPPPPTATATGMTRETAAVGVAQKRFSQSSRTVEDAEMLKRLAQRAVETLTALTLDYTFFFEQMQMVAEHEIKVFQLVSERKGVMQSRCYIAEKEFEIEQLRAEVEGLRKTKQIPTREDEETTDAAADVPRPSLAELYAKFSAPFIPSNVRVAPAVKLQPIVKLRKEALRVGARPASMITTRTAATTCTSSVSAPTAAPSPPGPAPRRSCRDATVPENDGHNISRSNSPRMEISPPADAESVLKSKDITRSFKRLKTVSPSSAICFISQERVPLAVQPLGTTAATHGVKEREASEGGSAAAAAAAAEVVRQVRHVRSSTSEVSSASFLNKTGDAVELTESPLKTKCMVERNSFDDSSNSESKKTDPGVARAPLDSVLRDYLSNEMATGAARHMESRGIRSDSSSTSITLTLDSNPGGRGKVVTAKAVTKCTDSNGEFSSSFDHEDLDAKGNMHRGDGKKRKVKSDSSDDDSEKRGKFLHGLRTLSFSSR